MKFTYILSALLANTANARNIARQLETIGSIDRWNNHQCDLPGPGLACHVREQGDVHLDFCNPTTDIDHFGGCRGSASVSSLRPGCSITVFTGSDCTGKSIVATDFSSGCLDFGEVDIGSFRGSCP